MEPLDFKTLAYATDRALLLWSLERQELLFQRLDSIMAKVTDIQASEAAETASLATAQTTINSILNALTVKLGEDQAQIAALQASNAALQATISTMAEGEALTQAQIDALSEVSTANTSAAASLQTSADALLAAVAPTA